MQAVFVDCDAENKTAQTLLGAAMAHTADQVYSCLLTRYWSQIGNILIV
jgi:hypothetical protein